MSILNKGKPKHAKPRRRWRTPLTALAVAASMAVAPTANAAMNGIDVASYQTDTVTCAVQDYDFAIVKATEGSWYRNPKMAAQLECARQRGKKIGVYHYASGADATSEADYFVSSIGGYRGQALLALDFEMGGNRVYYTSGAGDWIRAFVNRVHSVTGVWPVIYIPESGVWKIPADVRVNCAIWPAAYANMYPTGFQPNPWHGGKFNEAMRQYSSEGTLAGYAGRLDLDLFYGDGKAWDAYARGGHGATATVKPAPKPSAPAPAARNVRPVLDTDGKIGYETICQWQRVMGTPVDGEISGQYVVWYRPRLYAVTHRNHRGSALVRAIQRKYGLRQNGLLDRRTIRCIQRDVGTDPDGILGWDTARRIQIRLNTGRF